MEEVIGKIFEFLQQPLGWVVLIILAVIGISVLKGGPKGSR